jgi:small GTP-binding protein
MIGPLINALAALGVEASAEEVADAVWLALHMWPPAHAHDAAPGDEPAKDAAPAARPPVESPRRPEVPSPRPKGATVQSEVGTGARRRSLLAAKAGGKGEAAGDSTKPLRSPGAQGLPGALELARALRPLRRRVLSTRRAVFDEGATVRRIAEERLWLPVLQPAATRWLDVALVVDDGASMCVWRQTAIEFRRLLERQGAFRDVRVWHLKTDAPDGEVPLYAGMHRTARQPKELIDPTGRRLILLLTDCVSSAWGGPKLPRVLEEWGRRNHVAIVQVLPQRLWSQTALFEADTLRVFSYVPGTPNTHLRKTPDGWLDEAAAESVPFPILRLESVPAGAWAKVMTGLSGALAPAVAFHANGSGAEGQERAAWIEPQSPEERIRSFRATASATAYELALLLAAAPLTLSVMRLVQQALLPDSRHEHLAEVLLGGLLCREESGSEESDPETIQYDFRQGVRDLLLDAALVPDSLKVLRTVSEYIEQRFGQPLDFRALLLHPTAAGGAALVERNRAFASVAARVLRRLGGDYARIADAMEQAGPDEWAGLSAPEPFPVTRDIIAPRGLQLLHTLRVRGSLPVGAAWSADGELLAVARADGDIEVWRAESGEPVETLNGLGGKVTAVAWSPSRSENVLASSTDQGVTQLWRVGKGRAYMFQRSHGPAADVSRMAWLPNGITLIASHEDGTVSIVDRMADKGEWEWIDMPASVLPIHAGRVTDLAASPDGRLLALSSEPESRLLLWQIKERRLARSLTCTSRLLSLAWAPGADVLAAGCADGSIRVWYAETGQLLCVLEGHTDGVTALSYSPEGGLLASRAADGTVRLWRRETNEVVGLLEKQKPHFNVEGLAFHPHLPMLATQGGEDGAVRIWGLDLDILLGTVPVVRDILYTTAKIVLVGDSGVGKTGLGWRLAHGDFKEHPSTHGQQFWVVNELGATREDGTLCEAVLWDLAGQPDYRLVHALFLDDIDLALLLFDPTNRQEPLKGIEYWLKQLSRERRDGRKRRVILVGARADRGMPTFPREELEEFCKRNGIDGGYISTSAMTGEGVAELMARVKAYIPWDEMPATVTTVTFKRVKEFVLSLKEDSERSGLLVGPAELRERLEATDAEWEFTDAEMMTAVRHLGNHGYVAVLRGSSGEDTVLLSPELLANLAASFVLEARRNPRGLGALEETQVLEGGYELPELAGVDEAARAVLLDAATVLFLEHNLCFRETLGTDTFLIFPALINQRRPLSEQVETVDDYSYHIMGAVENVYAALVVQFGYTNTFTRMNQWQNQAEYETARGDICGFRQVEEREGESEFVLYYSKERQGAQLLFQGLFEEFLRGRDVTVTKFPPVQCPNCYYRQPRSEVVKRIGEGKGFLFCGECGKKITLPKQGEKVMLSGAQREQLSTEQVRTRRRTAFEAALVRVKAVVRDEKKTAPSCFISYAWGDAGQERWVRGLANDLMNAGVEVILDQKDNPQIGANVARFVSRIEKSDFVIIVMTPLYRRKYENKVSDAGSIVAAEVELINLRLTGTEAEKETVLPLLLEGDERSSPPPLARSRIYADFRDDAAYFVSLFDVILTLYRIPFEHPAVSDLRERLRASR